MKIINILISCALALGAVSCDNFLDVRPKAEKLEREMFKNAKGFEDAIYGVYGSMQSSTLYGRDLLWGVPEVLAQNLNCGSDDLEKLAQYNYNGTEGLKNRLSAIWKSAYQTIGYANNILEQLNDWTPEKLPRYNHYKGEMLGVRALLHFDLLRLYASTREDASGIPYVTAYSYSVKPFYKVGEVYQFILKDLLEAETLLSDEEDLLSYPRTDAAYSKFDNYQFTHFNLYAVRALLARVYWMKGDMANAALYAKKVIDSGKFPLVGEAEVQDFLAGVLSPKETVFGIYSTTYLATATNYLYNYQSFFSYDPYYDGSGKSHLLPYTKLYTLDAPATAQDFRTRWFVEHQGYARCLKLVDYYAIEEKVPTSRAQLVSGVTLIHSSEMYLIAAEALLDTDYAQALKYFDLEIASRGLTTLAARGVILTKDIIYNEYHKEMFGEGQVWFNMKRLNKDIQSNEESKVIPASDNVYVIPIPEEEYEYRN